MLYPPAGGGGPGDATHAWHKMTEDEDHNKVSFSVIIGAVHGSPDSLLRKKADTCVASVCQCRLRYLAKMT